MTKQQSVQSIDRALRILNVLAVGRGALSLTEIANQVKIPASTTHRLLMTLQQHDYVRLDETQRKYTLGLAILALGEAAKTQIDITKEASPILETLADQVNETATLTMLQRGEVVYVLMAQSRRSVSTVTPLGSRVPFHCTAAGKTILAYLPQAQRDALLNLTYKAYTRYTITNSFQLLDELAQIRAQGVGIDRQEYELGMCCIAAPVFNHQGQVIATIGISGPSSRVSPDGNGEFTTPVKTAAQALSEQLGYIESA